MTHDVMTYVDRTYRPLASRARRRIAGVSMGGVGTFYPSMRYE
jgi:enterochelin esterase-like enzyme